MVKIIKKDIRGDEMKKVVIRGELDVFLIEYFKSVNLESKDINYIQYNDSWISIYYHPSDPLPWEDTAHLGPMPRSITIKKDDKEYNKIISIIRTFHRDEKLDKLGI